MMFKALRTAIVAAMLVQVTNLANAQTMVSDPWVRATVAQQQTTAMYAQVNSAKGGRLVSVSSPLAEVVEIHEMAMQGNVMRMRAVPGGLELPAGTTVELKPGGYHVMLMGLRHQLKEGETVPLTFVVEGKDGTREHVAVTARVEGLTARAGPASRHKTE
jgi:copper(I)-binding protein